MVALIAFLPRFPRCRSHRLHRHPRVAEYQKRILTRVSTGAGAQRVSGDRRLCADTDERPAIRSNCCHTVRIDDYCIGADEYSFLARKTTSYPVGYKNERGAKEYIKWPPWKCFRVGTNSTNANAKGERA